ncbi:nucleotide sugar dehydrogenase [Ectothiorhodospira magna]|uniref:Nucleotide sugar dehydrogenase n=1 Tax=Ectothiorhodospira magna TaxID=867345 RepID=A0A1H9A1N3_9GAMM|nr:nucleotide sugar dehydrogenase [Ectothiorhodospira magna]SEP70525.1 nucleotide sugar dehydrogenase [Ectothiorhodospira magna]
MQKVCIQGLGFVGSAMATAVALALDEQGCPHYDVLGVDLPTKNGLRRVAALNEGYFPFETSDPKLNLAVARAHANGNLRATTDDSVYAEADIIVVDVHLDIPFLDEEPQLQFDGFEKAIRTIGMHMRPDALVIIETTVPPGTCEKVVVPCLTEELQHRGLEASELRLAHSYERVMPGKDYLDSVINFWRVYSGHTPEAADACEAFLSTIINIQDYPLTRLSSTTASETAKVMENTYRAVNISFISEWTRYAEKIGIDLFEVVKAIQMRPTHHNIRYPGLGIGGYCLTKDPTFAPAASKQLFGYDLDFPFSRLAVKTATEMPHHGVNRLEKLLGGSVKDRRILLCGVSYRQDVADTRYSPSETVYRELIKRGAEVVCHDPFVRHWEELDMAIPSELPSTKSFDAIMFAVPHSQYQKLDLVEWLVDIDRILVLDAHMVFNAFQRRVFREHGIKIESIGVGDGQ